MYTPLRMCVGCRDMLPKEKLIRIIKDKETGDIKIDLKCRLQGRGVYICKGTECIELAKKKKSLERAFKKNAQDIYEELEALV